MITLGCARNLVDSQKILGHVQGKGGVIVDVEDADIAIINTCGFIEDAKQESIDAIVDLVELKKQGKLKQIVIAGCLAQRYARELSAEFPEIDAVVGAQKMLRQASPMEVPLTPPHSAYLKICESCYNNCRFCVIPLIKGAFASRTQEAVLEDVRRMDQRGVKEVNIIGQDITAYGMDLYGEKRLASLLTAMTQITDSVEWIRLLYTFPAHITDALIGVIAAEDKICKYIDIPFQHISDPVLSRMNRKITKAETYALIAKIRERVPRAYLRTALIVGLPGETDDDFAQLMRFVKEARFEKLGVFMYSHEEGVPAYTMPDQVPAEVKEERYRRIMEMQRSISESVQARWLGKTVRVLIDRQHETEPDVFVGRTAFDAPEVDGVVYVHTDPARGSQRSEVKVGDFAEVEITHTSEYDLVGECV